MQRIDENTYIDDTLVTCAEYQLFIDEMREQGKYLQPDHWISYQFPVGHAREPILGVRYSDAIAFCDWVTSRETDKWRYRLPTYEEAMNWPIRVAEQSSFGYWVNETENQSRFALTTVTTDDIRRIGKYPDLKHELAFDPALARNRAPQLVRERILALERACDSTILHSRVRPLDFDLSSTRALHLARSLDNDVAHNRARYPELFQDIAKDLNRANELVLRRDSPLNLALTQNTVRDIVRDIVIALDIDIAKTVDNDLLILRSILDFILELYFDFFTMQERIAGRSPAFEGIRLVKEQLR